MNNMGETVMSIQICIQRSRIWEKLASPAINAQVPVLVRFVLTIFALTVIKIMMRLALDSNLEQ